MNFSLKVVIIGESDKFMACFLRKKGKNGTFGAKMADCGWFVKVHIISRIPNGDRPEGAKKWLKMARLGKKYYICNDFRL